MKNYIHTIIMNITVYKILIKAIIYHISFLASTYHYSPSEWMKMARKDIVHYNCFTNYEDAKEAQRRVIKTLKQFQKEIIERN